MFGISVPIDRIALGSPPPPHLSSSFSSSPCSVPRFLDSFPSRCSASRYPSSCSDDWVGAPAALSILVFRIGPNLSKSGRSSLPHGTFRSRGFSHSDASKIHVFFTVAPHIPVIYVDQYKQREKMVCNWFALGS